MTPSQAGEWAARGGPEALRQASPGFVAADPGGAVAWAENQDPAVFKGPVPPRRLRTNLAGGRPCGAPACRGAFDGLWWAPDGRRVVFVKRESGRGRGDDYRPRDVTAVYLWDPRRARVTRLLRTNDALDSCTVAAGRLYCLLETGRRPARLVRLALAARTSAEVLYDPNPAVGVDERISIRKQVYSDELGNVGYYYRVMGPTVPRAAPRPAVVIQYRARGFLRGGTGDEYPILPIVQQGAVALVFDQANYPLDRQGVRNMTGQLKARHAHVATIEAALDKLVEEGLADPQRLVITGLSSGAENLHYALQRTRRFAAAIASSSPVELNFLAIVPPVYRSFKERYEAAQVMGPNRNLSQLAWTAQPEKLHTPLLVNTTDREFLIGVEGFAALRDAGRPIEVRVFHDRAVHIKFDPANRAAVYALNLRWLDYWLYDRRDPAPELAAQYARWTAMKRQLAAEASR
jgi:acetyl esterase/lipase